MPTYLYIDQEGHTQEVLHRMGYTTGIVCMGCQSSMWRKPQAPRVNYGGDTSTHPIHPAIRKLIDEAPQRREKFAKEHEEHERRTANEGNEQRSAEVQANG